MKFPLITAAAIVAFTQSAPTVTSVSVVPAAGKAEVVVVSNAAPTEVQDFTLDAPRRIVVDIKGVSLAGAAPSYDRLNRGGVTNVRVSQYRSTTTRLVIELDSVHTYEVKRSGKEVRVVINGNAADFVAWRASTGSPVDNTTDSVETATPTRANVGPSTRRSTQPRITVTYQDADIRDVIAAFATFAGRTIVTGRDVSGTVTAEIKNQPWDVALRAILQGQGLAASEDPASGIITVDSYANIQAKQALEPLVTQLIPVNYAKADSLVPVITKLLARDCSVGMTAAGQGGTSGAPSGANCVTRGAVAANSATNTLVISETPSRMGEIINYIQNLDIRTPQVAIKAKIIFVNRTDIENLGLSYDLGTRNQFFNKLVQRTDPSTLQPIDTDGDGINDALGGGTAFTADQILLGGNTLSAIANANNRVTSPALSLVYSTALGKYSLTSFLDALQEVRLADLQAEPSIVTVDNKQAQIQVGQDVPVRVLDANTQGASGGTGNAVPRATVSFKPVGIILNVTPHITNNRQILLDVHAENSDAQIASSDVGYVFNKQSADNRILVNDGETAVIGGLTVTQVSQNKTGIPLLVDLPFIGKLFGTTNKSEEKRDLLILITPHVIDAGERVGTRGQ
jgi:type IV pilus assembly protein PilQ